MLRNGTSDSARRQLGRIISQLWTLRTASLAVAGLLEAGELPNVESACVKDLGTAFQQELPELTRTIAAGEGVDDQEFLDLLQRAIMVAPAYTIQGGTTEILRGIIARGLRLR